MIKLRPYRQKDEKVLAEIMKGQLDAKKLEQEEILPMTALNENGIVGYVEFILCDEKIQKTRMENLFIEKNQRGRGYGKELLSCALTFAFEVLQAECVSLSAPRQNVWATQCLRHAGFTPSLGEQGETDESLTDDNVQEQVLLADRYEEIKNGTTLVVRDMVTGLYNSRGFLECLENFREEGLYDDSQLVLLCIDIDGLENINKIYGYEEGNLVMLNLAKMLDITIDKQQICSHVGGNEFVTAFAIEQGQEAKTIDFFIHTIKGLLDTYNRVSGKEYSVVINYTYYSKPVDRDTDLQKVLEAALQYKRISMNKREVSGSKSKRNEEYFTPQEEMMMQNILDTNQLDYAFQPIVDVKTGDIYAYEALMRTKTEPKIPPLTVIMYADLNDRLYDIERLTMQNVVQKVHAVQNQLGDRRVFINSIPGCQLEQREYEKIKEGYGSLLKQLVIEVTEQTQLNDDALRVLLERSTMDSFGIAIDDFGSGYSNTSSLLRYLPNCVKIDRLLITNIHEEPKKQHFVKSIIEFCHDNGILALAEGVETHSELKAVINMGVDLIQGYYTGRPDFQIAQSIDESVKREIISAKLFSEGKQTRKIYMSDKSEEISLMRLVLEEYTGMLLADQTVTLIGNSDYKADFTIKVKDGTKAKLIIKNVYLESTQDIPYIDVGKGAELALVVEGDNALYGRGIRVPEEADLRLEGTGNLEIFSSGTDSYGIGNVFDGTIGSVYSIMSGNLNIRVDGSRCFGIGGGTYKSGQGIRIHGGSVNLKMSGESSVAIGCCNGDIPLDIIHCRMVIDYKVFAGIAAGTINGKQNIRLASAFCKITGSGSQLAGVGSYKRTGGNISILSSKVIISLNGQNVKLIASQGDGLVIEAEASGLSLRSEGSHVIALGCDDESGEIYTQNATFNIDIHAGENCVLGATPDHVNIVGGERSVRVNENPVEI